MTVPRAHSCIPHSTIIPTAHLFATAADGNNEEVIKWAGLPEELKRARPARMPFCSRLTLPWLLKKEISLFALVSLLANNAKRGFLCLETSKPHTCVSMGGAVGATARPTITKDLQALRRVHVSGLRVNVRVQLLE